MRQQEARARMQQIQGKNFHILQDVLASAMMLMNVRNGMHTLNCHDELFISASFRTRPFIVDLNLPPLYVDHTRDPIFVQEHEVRPGSTTTIVPVEMSAVYQPERHPSNLITITPFHTVISGLSPPPSYDDLVDRSHRT